MEKIQDYKIHGKLAETRSSIVYRGGKDGSEETVIIKVLKASLPSPTDIARFKKEYELIKNIDHDGVIKIHDFVEFKGNYSIIMEDFDAVSLHSLLKGNKRLETKSFLKIAIQVAEALGFIHRKGIIHCDIKPQNLLINPKENTVKITDFGIASLLTRENDEIYNPNVISGSLVYMSPEQTGRMNRDVDYRSDLYSLGVAFYEMLTGRVPFISDDPMVIIHSHIAVRPVLPVRHNPKISNVLSGIIMKLLSKNAEERYQSAFGLLADLKECLKRLKYGKEITHFELGRNDIADKFIFPQKLYGRVQELEILTDSFERVIGEGAGLMLVSGLPGIGKSVLINELHRTITEKKGYFLTGKYQRFRRDVPYSAIIQAYQGLVRQILRESDKRIEMWKERLLSALGQSGRVITDIIPEVEHIIGPQPELMELGAEESRNRFNYLFERFCSLFSDEENPVVLFLDDLQWADISSITFLTRVITGDISNFLLIGSYRSNEVTENHPLTAAVNRIEKNGSVIKRLEVGPISKGDVKNLIVDFLRCSEKSASMLAELVYGKTAGNPFFIIQFLHNLYNEKLIELDPRAGWKWEIDKIRAMKVTDNVVDLMVEKIGRLSANTQAILKAGACAGHSFDLELISILLGSTIDDILDDITPAISAGLINLSGGRYSFQHDRIHEAAYSLVSGEEKQLFHYWIGMSVIENVSETGDFENMIFYITDQLNLGSVMVKAKGQSEQLLRLNLGAGIKAKKNAAFEPSLRYLETGMSLFDEQNWKKQHDISIELYTVATEVSYMKGDYDRMMKYGKVVLGHTKDLLDISGIYQIWCEAKISQDDYMGALVLARPVLRRLGVRIPKKPSQLRLVPEFLLTWSRLLWKSDEKILKLPVMTDPVKLATVRLLSSIVHALFFAEPNILAFITFRMIRISFKFGLAPDHPFAYAVYGAVLCEAINDVDGSYRFGRLAMKMVERYNLRNKFSRTAFCFNILCRHWMEHRRESIEPSLDAFNTGVETGDLLWASLNLITYGAASALTGKECSELAEELERHNRMIGSLKQNSIIRFHALQWQYILNILGQCDNPLELQGKALDGGNVRRWEDEHNLGALAVFYFLRLTIRFLYNEYSLAHEDAKRFRRYKKAMAGVIILPHFYGMDIIIRYFLLMIDKNSFIKRILHRIYILTDLFFLKYWAKRAPMNSLNFIYAEKAMRMLLKDVRKRPSRRRPESNEYLTLECIRLCREHGDVITEGIANEILGREYLNVYRDEEKAREYIGNAYSAYTRWGAAGKLKQLRELYPGILSLSRREVPAAADTDSTTMSSSTFSVLDVTTILNASHAISGEVVLGRLLVRMMGIILQNAGAEKGFIILKDGDNLLVEAEGAVGSDEINVLKSIPIDSHEGLSPSIVNYVARTKEPFILNDASSEGDFSSDAYIVKNRPKSILSFPIVNQGKLSGVLYLENNVSSGAFTPERIEVLNMLSSQIAISINNAKLYENLEEEVNARTEELRATMKELENSQAIASKDMAMAIQVQSSLYPQKAPEIPGWDIAFTLKPAAGVSGDLYDFYVDDKELRGVVLLDVSGHGISSALVTMIARSIFERNFKAGKKDNLGNVLDWANKDLIREKGDVDKYLTGILLRFNGKGVEYVNAGHTDLICRRASTGRAELVTLDDRDFKGMFLGFDVMCDPYEVLNFNIAPGDTLLLYTDCLNESYNLEEEQYGSERIISSLNNAPHGSAGGILDYILNDFYGFMRGGPLKDDLTIIVLMKK